MSQEVKYALSLGKEKRRGILDKNGADPHALGGGESGLDFVRVFRCQQHDIYAELLPSVDHPLEISGPEGRLVIDQIPHTGCSWDDLLQQLQLLRDDLLKIGDAGDIAARAVSALHKSHCDRIGDMNKDDRYRGGCLLSS